MGDGDIDIGDIDIGGIDRRARTTGYGDGLMEIAAAIVLLAIALAWLVNPAFVGLLSAVVVLYGCRLFERAKTRVTYPRIGYYRERSDEPASTARGILVYIGGAVVLTVLVILISGGLSDPTEWRRAAPLMSGIGLAGGFWYAGTRSGLLRYRVIAALSIGGGLLLWWLGSGDSYRAVVVHLVGLAVPLAAIGVTSLVRFVRTNPVREPPGDG